MLDTLALILSIIGCANWGLVGIFQFDLVAWLFGGQDAVLSRIIYSVITSDNLSSIAFHKKIGYEFIAEFPGCGHKFGRTLGTVWLEKRVDFVEYPHEFPAPCRSIVENDQKLQDILDTLSLS